MAPDRRVIIAGAGPAGLTAALCLVDAGIPVTVIEPFAELAIDLRAGSYHPPTLEMLAPYGVTQRMHERGVIVPRWQIRDRRDGVLVEFDLSLLRNDTPYPYRLHLEQHKLTPILLDECRRRGGFEIYFATSVTGFRQDGDGVTVTVQDAVGQRELRGAWLIGADGARSTVREGLGIEFEGFTWPELFLVVSTPFDYEPHGYTYATYVADPDEWLVLFKVPGLDPPALWRLAFPADASLPPDALMAADVIQARLQSLLPQPASYKVVHRNLYRVHQRVAKRYGFGRVALAGDAAHVNNPLGGMGLNGAVHDAVSLAEKIVRATRREMTIAAALNLYERQRRPVQIDFVQRLSIRNKRLVEERDPRVRAQRQAELRAIGADRRKMYDYLLDSSMISMVRKAAELR
jgi:3-(3-hydroxy-phenyl)propionate hydroxylase